MVGINTGRPDQKNREDFGRDKPLPGRYHVYVASVDETLDKRDSIVVDFKVLAGTVAGQEGKIHTEFFSVSEAAMARLQVLAGELGLIQYGSNQNVDVRLADGIGRQLIIDIEPHSYISDKTGKPVDTTRITFVGMYNLNHPDVRDVPRDMNFVYTPQQDFAYGANAPAGIDPNTGQPIANAAPQGYPPQPQPHGFQQPPMQQPPGPAYGAPGYPPQQPMQPQQPQYPPMQGPPTQPTQQPGGYPPQPGGNPWAQY